MTTDTDLSPHDSIRLIKDTKKLSNLKAIPKRSFYFAISLITGLSFGFLSNQSMLALIPIALLPVLVYIQKNKKGLWPIGFVPFLRQGDGLYSFNDYCKDMLKVNTYIHVVNLISILIMLSFPLLFIRVLEFRDQGNWWAPIACGTIMGLSHLIILINYRNFQIIKFSNNNNE